jgi:hypothetical protein
MQVIAISRSEAIAVLDDGTTAQFSNMFDRDGDETEDVAEAVTAVVRMPDGMWEVLDLQEFEPVSRH